MGKLSLPEHLELLLTDEPFLDLYGYGPWRVPGGLAVQVCQRARELTATAEARSLRAEMPMFYRPDATRRRGRLGRVLAATSRRQP